MLHNTESAILKVFNDILIAGEIRKCTVLFLLDPNTAFNTVDHTNVLDCLKSHVGILALVACQVLRYFS